jgi:hypothetical protein
MINVIKDFGAGGRGLTDDTTALQNAVNSGFGQTIDLVDGVYLISSPIVSNCATATKFRGENATILSATNAPMLQYNTNPGAIAYASIDGLIFENFASGLRTIAYGINVFGSNGFGYSDFSNSRFLGTYYGINFAVASSAWNTFHKLQFGNTGGNTNNICIRRTGQSGQAIYTSNTFISEYAGLYIDASDGGSLGDFCAAGNNFESNQYCVYINGAGAVYKENFSVSGGNKFDVAPIPVYINGCHDFRVHGNAWGGGVQKYVTDVNCSRFVVDSGGTLETFGTRTG